MNKLYTILSTSRPIYWISHWMMFYFGASASQNFSFSLRIIFPLLLLSLPFSLFVYAVNDAHDIKSDQVNTRKGGAMGHVHRKNSVSRLLSWGRWGIISSLLLGFFTLPPLSLVILILLILDLYYYSAPPIHFKSIPILDGITGGLLYGFGIAIMGYLYYEPTLFSFRSIPQQIIFMSALALIAQLMGTVVDIRPDKKQGVTTSAIHFGPTKVILFCILFLVGASSFLTNQPWLRGTLLTVATLLTPYFHIRFRETVFAKVAVVQIYFYSVYAFTLFYIFLHH